MSFLAIDSRYRVSGTAEKFRVFFQRQENIKRITLSSVELINGFYTINSDVLTVNGTPYTLTTGWYDANSLAAMIQLVTGITSVTFSLVTGKLTFTNGVAITLGYSRALGEILGLSGVSAGPSTSIVSTYVCKLSNPDYVFISLGNVRSYVYTTNSQGITSAQFKVPVTVSIMDMIAYTENNDYNTYLVNQDNQLTLEYLDVELITPNGLTAANNGLEWSFMLKFEYYPSLMSVQNAGVAAITVDDRLTDISNLRLDCDAEYSSDEGF